MTSGQLGRGRHSHRAGTVAGAEQRLERRSGRQIALGRCAVRMRGIDRLGVTAEVLENPFNDRGRLDAGNDPQTAAALPAGLDVDGEHPPEALRPVHRPLPIGGRCLDALVGSGAAGAGRSFAAETELDFFDQG